MVELTTPERDFLECDGAIWCIENHAEKCWSIYKVTWEYVDTLNLVGTSEEVATQWAYLLADLALPTERIALHHLIKRRYGDEKYPQLDGVREKSVKPNQEQSDPAKQSLIKLLWQRMFGSKNRSLSAFRFKRQAIKKSESSFQRQI